MSSLPDFPWPGGKRAALSLSFDDSRESTIDRGVPILDSHGLRGTFYVVPNRLRPKVDDWRAAVANGHEMGCHSLTHPCTANYSGSLERSLESLSLGDIEGELDGANEQLEELFGVVPETFAYPCGQKFVGTGARVQSYVPLVAKRFLAGRGYRDEDSNAPLICDLAQLTGMPLDGASFDYLKQLLDRTLELGKWLILAGHDVGVPATNLINLNIEPEVLDEFCAYAAAQSELWTDTVANVARHVRDARASLQTSLT